MKKRVPSYWTLQLLTIIFLFSAGVSFFPTGMYIQDLTNRAIQRPYSYRGGFTANLTNSNPIEHLNLGHCSDITIQEWTLTPATPILLQIRSHDNTTRFLLPIHNETSQATFARFNIYLSHNTYILDAIRQTNNTFFHCWISAYPFYPAAPSITYITIYWGIGLALIILAIPLTYRFYNITKEAILNDSKF